MTRREKELTNRRQFIKFNHQRVQTRNFYRISQVFAVVHSAQQWEKVFKLFCHNFAETCCLLLFPSPAKVGWNKNGRDFAARGIFLKKNIWKTMDFVMKAGLMRNFRSYCDSLRSSKFFFCANVWGSTQIHFQLQRIEWRATWMMSH